MKDLRDMVPVIAGMTREQVLENKGVLERLLFEIRVQLQESENV